MTTAPDIFKLCVQAVRDGDLIEREGRSDKEFHFQNWFKNRLDSLNLNYDSPGRNTYPDFRLVHSAEGYEVKGLAYPGREADYDCNSQVPRGGHNGRSIYYVFGRYPARPDGNRYPVLDLVLCHGGFLNAEAAYVHKNKSFRGFGSYGDILVRDRKMYVAPTPFALVDGTAHRCTLILPSSVHIRGDFIQVGSLVRREADEITVAYNFDLQTNALETTRVPNPTAGRRHEFAAYRLNDDNGDPVSLRAPADVLAGMAEAETIYEHE
ncbi:MAG: hypothetical protein ABSD74_06075 [Rhizomicrobium sp.]|jgi:hypothetical protein